MWENVSALNSKQVTCVRLRNLFYIRIHAHVCTHTTFKLRALSFHHKIVIIIIQLFFSCPHRQMLTRKSSIKNPLILSNLRGENSFQDNRTINEEWAPGERESLVTSSDHTPVFPSLSAVLLHSHESGALMKSANQELIPLELWPQINISSANFSPQAFVSVADILSHCDFHTLLRVLVNSYRTALPAVWVLY